MECDIDTIIDDALNFNKRRIKQIFIDRGRSLSNGVTHDIGKATLTVVMVVVTTFCTVIK